MLTQNPSMQTEKMAGTLKEQLNSITPALQEMQMRKEARVKQFMEVQTEIQRIASEIAGRLGNEAVNVNEEDLSLKKLEEFQSELQRLKREKSDRLCKVEEYKVLIHNFAKVMGMDPSKILANVHPRLLDGPNEQQTKNISDDILKKLNMTVQQLKEEKNNRREKVIYHTSSTNHCSYTWLANTFRLSGSDTRKQTGLTHFIFTRVLFCSSKPCKALTNLWDTLDTTMEERQPYGQINILAMTSVNGMLGPGSLTLETIQQVCMLRCKMETEMQHKFTTYKNVAGLVEQLMAKTQFWEQERNKTFYYDEVRPHELLTELWGDVGFINISLQENKKIQTLLVKRHENTVMLRPNTSFSRPSSRGFNTSPGSTSIWSNQVSAKVQLLPDSDNSPAEKDMHAKRIRNRALQSALANSRSCSNSHEDKTSVSTVKQGLSPM
ncbi:hypothetical protein HU200_009286 [Digitaria exilis]|uniref:Uncharacterized protein n=1 Tax=Digitaria exilis TaxID=1010633 RepID=A0A835KN75_9POAL|nr:hypothetical protein HU200_009286 [Digitaria exilis]